MALCKRVPRAPSCGPLRPCSRGPETKVRKPNHGPKVETAVRGSEPRFDFARPRCRAGPLRPGLVRHRGLKNTSCFTVVSAVSGTGPRFRLLGSHHGLGVAHIRPSETGVSHMGPWFGERDYGHSACPCLQAQESRDMQCCVRREQCLRESK